MHSLALLWRHKRGGIRTSLNRAPSGQFEWCIEQVLFGRAASLEPPVSVWPPLFCGDCIICYIWSLPARDRPCSPKRLAGDPNQFQPLSEGWIELRGGFRVFVGGQHLRSGPSFFCLVAQLTWTAFPNQRLRSTYARKCAAQSMDGASFRILQPC